MFNLISDTKLHMRNLFLISAFAMLVSCQKIDLQQGTLGIIGCETNPDECFQTLHFSSEQALKDAIAEEYSNTSTKSAPGFISYYETVMSEPYYMAQTLYGVSIRGDEMRGSKVIYEYNGSIEN